MTALLVCRTTRFITLALALGVSAADPTLAQSPSGPPNALQGFSQNRNQPVQIDAATLEVRDKDKIATFLGNVRMIQGDTTMRCNTMKVFYDQDATPGAMPAAKPGPGGSQQIKRLEAIGNVVVTQKDQKASGDNGVFDMKTNTVTLLGGVVVTQGQNILRGERLVVDLTTGVSRVESGHNRVQGLFLPSSGPEQKPGNNNGATSAGPPAGREQPKAHPAGPSGLY